MAAAEQAARRTRKQRQRRPLIGTLSLAVAVVAAAVAASGGQTSRATAAQGARLSGGAFSSRLFAGIPQRGTLLGRAGAPVRLVEFADLQCPYCDEYAVQTLPSLVANYVRQGKLQM